MAITSTSSLSAEVKAMYDPEYYLQGQSMVYFDQLCDLKMAPGGQRGSTVNFPIVESLQPNASALDEVTDVSAQAMSANEVVITLAEYGGAVEVTKFAVATSYADVYEQAAYVNGYNMAESFDMISRAVMGQGTRAFLPSGVSARTSIDGLATAAHRLSASAMEQTALMARSIKMPMYDDNTLAIVLHPFNHYDLLQDSDVRTMASRQNPEILFNGEIAFWSGMRVIVTSNQKAFYGGGLAAATALNTTLAAAAARGDTNLKVVSVTNAAVGDWFSIQDGAETGNTWYDSNELFRATAIGTTGASGTGIDGWVLDPGPGDGGGLRYAHASGTPVKENGTVYPMVVVGPNSVSKAYSDFTGPYGETVVTGPFDRLGRFLTLGWYAIVGYQRTRNGWLLRREVGSSQA